MKQLYTTLILSFLFLSPSFSQSGTLDPTFGTGGYDTYIGPGGTCDFKEMALQSDGKIVAVGYYKSGTSGDFIVCRYNNDGSLDQSFGTSGVVTYDIDVVDSFWSVDIQNDGKIVAAGLTSNGISSEIAVARFNTDGSFDSSFGTNGIAIHNFNGQSDRAWAVKVQSDGKIVIAGSTRVTPGNFDQFVARLSSTGTLDTGFNGGTGYRTYDLGTDESVEDLTIQPDGKIVIVGSAFQSGFTTGFISRLSSAGTPDPAFANTGTVLYSPTNGDTTQLTAVAVRPDGRILIAGYQYNGLVYDVLLLQLNNSNFLPDASFGTNGISLIDINGRLDVVGSMVLQSDGRAVLAGASYTSLTMSDQLVLRVETDGSLDASFGNNGVTLLDHSTEDEYIHDCLLDQQDKIVVAGGFQNGNNYDAIIARLIGNVVGIPNKGELLSLTAYPNPFNDEFVLRSTEQITADVSIAIHDASGRLVSHDSELIEGHSIRILLHDAPGGYYTLTMISENGVSSIPIIQR